MSSPRRGGSEESILELLERDTVRTRAIPGRSRFGWYMSGSVLAGLLVSLLVWLARESPDVRQMDAVLAAADTDRPTAAHAATDSADADEGPAMSHAPAASKAATAGMAGAAATTASPATATGESSAAAMTARTATANHAAIIDEQHPSSRKQDAQQHLPPIVLATPGLLGAVPPAQSGSGAVVQDEAADIAAKPAPPSTQATAPDERKQPASPQAQQAPQAQQDGAESRPAAAASQAAPEPASAAASAAEPQQPAKQAGTDTPRSPASAKARTSNKVLSASVRSKPRKLARNTGKAKRTAATAAQTQDARTDSDVALISAVIQHATNRPAAGCADAECAAKATPQQ